MKRMNALTLSFTYAGCFLGAGFVSGQELWQFFGSFGVWGYVGFVLSAALFVAFGVILMRLTQMTGLEELDRIMVPWEKLKWLRKLGGLVTTLFLFGVIVLMSAGVGALGAQLFGIPAWIGSAVFTLLVCIIALFGVTGMITAFSALIPVLVIATLLFAVGAWTHFDTGNILRIVRTSENPLMPNWLIAALTFVAYNLLGGIGIMVPVGPLLHKRSTVWWGMILAGVELVIVAGAVLTSVASYPAASAAQLPMVAVGSALSRALGTVYGGLLFLGMFCNSLASLVALVTHLSQRMKPVATHKTVFLGITAVVIWGCSLYGFAEILAVVFPIFGYLSIVFMVTMAVHFVQEKRKEKAKQAE